MALNFPASPVLNDTFTDGTTTWKWNGTAWLVDSGAVAAANVDQFKTVAGDTGSTTANSPTDTLTIAGGTNMSSAVTGDIVTLNMTTGEYTGYDVKTKNYRKSDYTAKDGYRRKRIGSLISRGRTKEQIK